MSSLIKTKYSVTYSNSIDQLKSEQSESILGGCGRCPVTWELASVLLSLSSELWHLPAQVSTGSYL